MIIKNCKLMSFLTSEKIDGLVDVVVKNHKIEKILPGGSCIEDENVLDIHGATLLPGLIDAHVHLFMGSQNGGFTGQSSSLIPSKTAFDAYNYASWFLENGYTTIRDVGDEENYCGIATRNAILNGQIQGPRIYCSGMTIVPVTAGFDSYKFMSAFYSTVEDMRKEARNQFYHGADFLKIYGTGSMLEQSSMPGRRIMMKDEVEEAVKVARLRGSYCACHCHGQEAIGVMIDSGVKTIEHASFISEDSCQKLDGRKDVGIVLTIACSCKETTGTDQFDVINEKRDLCLRNAYENHDVLMGWGTDMDLNTMKQMPYIEWQMRKKHLGISNKDLLKQATINSAMLMGIDQEVGTIDIGKLADFIVVDGDPEKDIEVMYHKPMHVIKEGKIIY